MDSGSCLKNHMDWQRMPETEEDMTNQRGHGQVTGTGTGQKKRADENTRKENQPAEIILDGREKEEAHLAECLTVIKANIAVYEEEVKRMNAEIKQMYDQYHDNDPEIFTELSNTIPMNENMK
nr:hypothetical protein [Lachnospiraceae bacterium]